MKGPILSLKIDLKMCKSLMSYQCFIRTIICEVFIVPQQLM